MATPAGPEVNKSQSIRAYLEQYPTVHPKEVVAALAAEGINVTESQVYVVRGKLKPKGTAGARNGAAARARSASAEGPNKSQAVRELLQEQPRLSTDDIISTLAGRGVPVKRGLIYFVKGKMKSRKQRQTRERVATELAAPEITSADAVTTIKRVKTLAAEFGGMRRLKALVDALTD